MSELQAKIQQVSTLASERDAQVISLQEEMKDQELRAKQSEDDLRRELEEKQGRSAGLFRSKAEGDGRAFPSKGERYP